MLHAIMPSGENTTAAKIALIHMETEMTAPNRLDRHMAKMVALEVEADLSESVVTGIRVSGSSVLVSHGEMKIPEGV